jgi:DNA-binding transcriptional regulator YdaS (Cro superfamily)
MKKTQPTVADVIERLGGPTKAAEALGISNPSVVLNWRKRQSIPADKVMAVSRLTGIPPHDLRPDVFAEAS